jgi:hypothetical protein
MQKFDYVYWDSGYTSKGNDLIKESFNNAELMLIDEKLSHDGYDRDGPKSDIWDLWILEKTSDDYLLHNFHWENWFCKDDKYLKYELELTNSLSELIVNENMKNRTNIYNQFIKYAKLCKATTLLNSLNKIDIPLSAKRDC